MTGWLTLAVLCSAFASPGVALAQACPDDRVIAHLTVPRDAAAGQPTAIEVGLDAVTHTGFPDCGTRLAPRDAEVELSVASSPDGPWRAIARTGARTVAWTPPRPGLSWLRVRGRADGERLEVTRPILVASVSPRVRVSASLAELETGVSRVPWRAEADGAFALPAADAWWRLVRRRRVSWLRVRADGTHRETEASASVALALDDVSRAGWRVRVDAGGAPLRERRCRSECVFDELPPGPVRIRVAPVSGGPEVELTSVASTRASPLRLCTPHLLAGHAPPEDWRPEDCGRFDAWPLGGETARDARCHAGAPIELDGGTLWVGDAVCADGRARALPALEPATVRTRPVAALGRVLVAERRTGLEAPIRVVVAGVDGLTAAPLRALPEREGEVCVPAALAVTDDGAIAIGGRCERRGRTEGFVAFLEPTGRERVLRTREPIVALATDGAAVRAASDLAVLRCRRRCRAIASLPEPSIALLAPASAGGAWRVVGRSGTVRELAARGARRSRVVATPPVPYGPSRIVEGGGEVYALFGPVVLGSEYHPYCVASAVARLEANRWRVVHATGEDRGRAPLCTDDDTHRLVIDIAIAHGVLYARHRTRTAEERELVPLRGP